MSKKDKSIVDIWKATCMQTMNHVVNRAANRDEAMLIVNKSLDRWDELLASLVASNGSIKQLYLFPEFNLQGFPLNENVNEWIEKACLRIPGSSEVERIQKMAQKYKIYIGANAYESPDDWPGRYFNCSFLIDPSGDIILKFRRINTTEATSPHDVLDEYLDKHGVEGLLPVAETELGNIAMMPCGEIAWPETARALTMRGAEIILHPTSDHGKYDQLAWESCKRARAAENMVYFISSNAGGMIGGPLPEGSNYGNSKIIDFNGQVMVQNHGPGESSRASAVIDMDALRRVRTASPGIYGYNRLGTLRTEVYRPVYEETVFYPSNSFAEKPMSSKKQIGENIEETVNRKINEGVFYPPKIT